MTPTQRAKFFQLHDGICYLCSRKIAQGELWEVEHELARGLGGAEGDNRRLCHVDCHKPKTRNDIQMMRKADRQAKKNAGIKKRSSFQNSRTGKFKTRLTSDGPRTVRR